jgi:hypothetical protein
MRARVIQENYSDRCRGEFPVALCPGDLIGARLTLLYSYYSDVSGGEPEVQTFSPPPLIAEIPASKQIGNNKNNYHLNVSAPSPINNIYLHPHPITM